MIDIPYTTFATALSVVVVVEYFGLLLIVARRAAASPDTMVRLRLRVSARYIEGPTVAFLFLIAVAILVGALALSPPLNGAGLGQLAISAVRGLLFTYGFVVFMGYWRVRSTWLP